MTASCGLLADQDQLHSAMFGIALALWGLATARRVEALLNHVMIHATLVFDLLFLPFTIDFLVIIAIGN